MRLERHNLDAFARDLATHAPEVARRVTAAAMTRTAAAAVTFGRASMASVFTLRNRWSVGSLRSTRASPHASEPFALAGTPRDYLALQETGGSLGRTRAGRRITTPRGSREGDTARPRRRLAAGALSPRNVTIAPPAKRVRALRGRGQRAMLAVRLARRKGHRFVWLDLGRKSRGIFDVRGRGRIHLVHSFRRERLRVPARPWFGLAVRQARSAAPAIFFSELRREPMLRDRVAR